MRAGTLDRKISILRAARDRDSAGEAVLTWQPVSVVRRSAQMRPLKGEERFATAQFVALEQVEFRIRWSTALRDLSPLDRIIEPALEDGLDPVVVDRRQYDIMAVHEIGRREGLQILAARRVDQIPGSEALAEFITKQPGTGNLIVSGYAPAVVLFDEFITKTPATGALTATGYAPTAAIIYPDLVAEPATGALTATGYAPAVTLPYNDLVATPATGALTATGYAPTVQIVEPSVTEIIPGAGELTATGYAPAVTLPYADLVAEPATGALTATGYAPTVAVDAGVDSILLETGDALLLEAGGPVELDTSIPAQDAADPLDGTEWTVIVQGGTTKKVATATLAGFLNG